MKKTVIILSVLLSLLQTLQAQQPRFTEFRTDEEIDEWLCKIVDETNITDYTLQLVSSKAKSDYSDQWVCVQIFEKTTGKFVQEIDLRENYYAMSVSGGFRGDDYNFDGYEDFSIWGGYASYDNGFSYYFLFDPETKTFFESNFDGGTNLQFHSDTKTITSSNRCCAGSQEMYQTYKLVDNKMVLLEQKCLAMIIEDGEISQDEEGYPNFEEEDCNPSYWLLNIQLQSVGLKKNFQLRMAIYDEDMAGGFVQYKGQKERIPIHFDRSEEIEETESYPDGSHRILFYYNEMYKGEINGVYSIVLRDTDHFVDSNICVYYVREKDKKVFTLKVISNEKAKR
jgi:hypothetical protein